MLYITLNSPQSSATESNRSSKSINTIEEYLEAANQGHADAQYNLSVIYENSKGVSQDYSKAMEWYLKADNQGHAADQSNLGFMYESGMGVPRDNSTLFHDITAFFLSIIFSANSHTYSSRIHSRAIAS